MTFEEASTKLRDMAKELATQIEVPPSAWRDDNHLASVALQLAWCESVRDKFYAIIEKGDAELKRQHAIAVQMMREDRYDGDPICMPRMKPMVATVGGDECVCFDHSMINGVPLSAIYMDQAKATMDLAARIPSRPFPITYGGKTFSSIDDLRRSESQNLRGLADALSQHSEQLDKLVAEILSAAPELEHVNAGTDDKSI